MKKKLFWHLVLLVVTFVLTGAQLSLADPLDNWHWKNPLPQGNALRSVSYGSYPLSPSSSRFVAVGDYGTILTSTDGSNWNNRTALNAGSSGTRNNLRGVAFGNLSGSGGIRPGFVAAGDNGTIIKSADGIGWSLDQSAGITDNLAAVAYGVDGSGSQSFVGVGANGVVVRTFEGTSWSVSRPAVMTGQSLNGITYGNLTFVAISNSGNIFYSTDNGASWAKSPDSNSSTPLNGISFVNNKFVAVGTSGTLLQSDDGIHWGVQSTGTAADLYAVTYGSNNGTYLVVGSGASIINSTALVKWDPVLNPPASNYNLYSIAQDGNNTYVAVGDFGEILLYKPSAVTWSLVKPAPATAALAISPIFPNSTIYAGAGAGALYASGSNGDSNSWSFAGSGLPALDITSLVSDPLGTLYAGTIAGPNGGLYKSIDGATNWYKIPITAPLLVSATAGNSQVSLNWQAVPGASSYNVYRSTSPISNIPSGSVFVTAGTSLVQNSLTNGTTYYYVVTANTAIQESVASSQVSATPQAQVVGVPFGAAISTGVNQNTLSWSAVPGATSYNIYWSATAGVTRTNGTKISGVSSPYNHPVANGTLRYYVITAVSGGVESAESVQLAAIPQASDAAIPQAAGVTSHDGNLAVSWTPPAGGADSYNLYWSTTEGVSKANGTKIAGVSPGYVHTALANGSLYFYVVTAVKGGIEGAESGEFAAAPGAQVIAAPYPVAAKADDGQNTITFNGVAAPGATYNLYWSTTPDVSKAKGTVINNVTSPYLQGGLTNGTTYYYVVTAVSGGVESAESSMVSAQPQAPGIQFSQISAIAVEPANLLHIWAGTDSGLFKSVDGGRSWSEVYRVTASKLSFQQVKAIAFDPTNSSVVYVGTASNERMFRSTNGGSSWNLLPSVLDDGTPFTFSDVNVITIDPVATTTLYVGTAAGAWKSTNSGATWAATNPGLGLFGVYSIVINPKNTATIYMGTDLGVYLSYNAGTDWAVFNTGLQSSANVRALAINPNTPGLVFAGNASGVNRIANTSFVWASQRHDVVYDDEAKISRTLQAIASGNNALVAAGPLNTMFTVNDGVKRTAAGDFTGIAFGNSTFLAVGPGSSALSTDNGVSWGSGGTAGNAVAFGNGAFVTATGGYQAIAFGNNTFVEVGVGGGIQSSIDGSNWTVSASPTSNFLKGVAFGDGVFVAVGAGGTVLKSTDNGANWQIIAQPSSLGLNGVAYANGQFVAVGQDPLHGIILTSADRGSTWVSRPSGSVNSLNGVTFGNSKFYAVGDSGTVIFSDPIPAPAASVTAITPANGATGVPVDTPLSATFSADMNPASFTTSADGSSGSFAITPAITGASVAFDSANFRAVLSHSGDLAYSTSYKVTLSTAIHDAAGNALPAAYVWQFTTAAAPDTTPPQVAQTSPGNSGQPAVDVPVSAVIQVTFSKSIDPSTVNSSTFKVTDASNINVAGSVAYNGLTATFTPSSPLLKGTSYTVTITNGIKDMAGNALPAPYTWGFTTLPAYTVTVSSTGSGSVTPGTVVIDKGSSQSFTVNADAGFSLSDLTVDGSSVLGLMTGNVFTLSNVIAPHALVATFKKTYQIQAFAGAYGSATVYSKSGAGASQFTKLALKGLNTLNSQNGRLFWTIQQNGANVTFSLYKDPTDVSSLVAAGTGNGNGTMTLSAAGNSGLYGSVDVFYSADSMTLASNILNVAVVSEANSPFAVTVDSGSTNYLTFTPTDGYVVAAVSDNGAFLPYPYPTSYLLTDILADHQIYVGFAVDVTPPQVNTVVPADGATNISPAAAVKAVFSKAMDATTINSATFIVKDAGGNSIPGIVSYSGVTATFFPLISLSLNTKYTATVTSEVRDLSGNAMGQSKSWNFTVASAVQYLTMVPGTGGTVTPTGTIPVPTGLTQTFVITPSPSAFSGAGAALLDITVDGVSIGAANLPPLDPVTGTYNYTTDPVNADHRIGVAFTTAYHTLTVESMTYGIVTNGRVYAGYTLGISGSGLDTTSVRVPHGANTTWTIIPDSGYLLNSIIFNGVLQNIPAPNADGSYSFITPPVNGDSTLLCTFNNITTPPSQGTEILLQIGANGIVYYGGLLYKKDGTMTFGLSADMNSQATMRIVPDPGYGIANIHVNELLVPLPVRQADGSYLYTLDVGQDPVPVAINFATDNVNPLVIATTPANNATGIDVLQPVISATFSKQINPVTLTPVNFSLVDNVTGVPVPGTVRYDGASRTATLTPTMPLTLGHGYTVTTTPGVMDPFGNPLVPNAQYPTSWTFTTRTATHAVTVGVGSDGTVTTPLAAGGNPVTWSNGTQTVTVNDNNNLVLSITPHATGVRPWYGIGTITVDGVPTPQLLTPDANGKFTFTLANVIANHAVQVNFIPLVRTIVAAPVPNGTITGSPALDASGTAGVSDNSNVTLTFTPASGYGLASLTDNGVPLNLASPPAGLSKVAGSNVWSYTLQSVVANHTIVAAFSSSFTVNVSYGTGGYVSPGTSTVPFGGSKVFTMVPDAGYYFQQLYVNGTPTALTDPAGLSYTASQITFDQSLSATFSKYDYYINVASPASGTIMPGGMIYGNLNDVKSFTFTPATGFDLTQIVVDGKALASLPLVNTDGSYSYTMPPLTKVTSLSAVFDLKKKKITLSPDLNGTLSSGSVVAKAGTSEIVNVYYGGAVTIAVTPAANYILNDITLDDVSVKNQLVNNSLTLRNVTDDHTVKATFSVQRSITATAGANGSISPSGITLFSVGSSQEYTYTPSAGYQVATLTVGGVAQTVDPLKTSYTFTNIQQDSTINVTFAPITFSVKSANIQGLGTMTPDSVTVNYGATQSFTMMPKTGYKLTDVKLDGVSVFSSVQSNIYTLKNITADHTITPVFDPVVFAFTVQSGTGGSISGPSEGAYGSDATFTVTPDDHYSLVDLKLDGVSVKSQMNGSNFTIKQIAGVHTLSASFAVNTYAIKATAGTGGSITPTGTTTLSYGATQVYTVAAADGYNLKDVQVDGVSVLGSLVNGTYTFASVSAGHTINAIFIPIVYPDGDVNLDGKFDLNDALYALQIAVGAATKPADMAAAVSHGDVAPLSATGKPVGDKKIDIADAMVLLQRVAGIVKPW